MNPMTLTHVRQTLAEVQGRIETLNQLKASLLACYPELQSLTTASGMVQDAAEPASAALGSKPRSKPSQRGKAKPSKPTWRATVRQAVETLPVGQATLEHLQAWIEGNTEHRNVRSRLTTTLSQLVRAGDIRRDDSDENNPWYCASRLSNTEAKYRQLRSSIATPSETASE